MSQAQDRPLSREAQRLLELLADQAAGQPLSVENQAELDALLRRLPAEIDARGEVITADYYSDVAGAALVVLSKTAPTTAVMPADARARLLARGQEIARENAMLATMKSSAKPAGRTASSPTEGAKGSAGGVWGWLAAAAAIAVAAVVYVNSTKPAPILTSAQQASALVAKPGTITLPWTPTAAPEGSNVTGQIVWNNSDKKGWLVFKGLATNDPTKMQYQLWIFDEARGATPMSAGVFDVKSGQLDASTGNYYVPFEGSLPVTTPTTFALTIEKPGGNPSPDVNKIIMATPVK